jgi:hypothetical protein
VSQPIDKTHFTAVVKVTKSVYEDALEPGPGRGMTKVKKEREVLDVANVVIRADSLEKLREKVGAHVALIEED